VIKVVKFGGTSVGTPARFRRAARAVARQVRKGNSVVVVVSAMGSSTDDTLDLVDALKVKVSDRARDEILSLGERMSVRLLWALLEAEGINSTFLDPSMTEWPVVSDSQFGDARVDLQATLQSCRRYLKPILEEGCVPVVCGFLGRDPEGRITTLGRGASDQTAFLLGHCLEADEVIIVTDVEGVMSADPRIVRNTKLLDSIYVEELWDLSVGGARVMNSRALRYKLEGQRARIVHFRTKDLDSGGTEIMGSTPSGSEVVVDDRPVSPVTIVGDEMSQVPGLLAKFAGLLSAKGINVLSVSTGRWSISFFVEAERAEAAVKTLHGSVLSQGPAKAVTKGDRCAMITIAGREFIQTPGIIARALAPLAENRVNVVEVSTSRAEITIFVNWKDRRTAVALIGGSLSEMDPR
jgi:aspartate kinase